jgi:glycosyltransferase involved in cell wall biosynthesis
MSPRPVVVLCSAWPPGVGGAVSFALRFAQSRKLAAAFELKRHQILKRPSVFVPHDRPLAQGALGRPIRAGSAMLNLVNYCRVLIGTRPDIVHFNYNGKVRGALLWEAAVYLKLARWFGARTAVRLGGQDHFFELPSQLQAIPPPLLSVLRHLDLLVVQCDAWRNQYEDWLGKAGVAIPVATVPNTVDLAAYVGRRASDHQGRELRVGCIAGPETNRKGAYILLDSVVALGSAEGCTPFKLEAAWATEAFRAAVQQRRLQDRVVSLGILSPQERRDWLTNLDVFVLPSLAEGFPNVLMEAMASGVPVVASTAGAIPHVVQAGVEAELVPPGDSQALAAALRRLLGDAGLRQQRSEAGLGAVRARYSLDGGWDDVLVREYRRLLAGVRHPGGER